MKPYEKKILLKKLERLASEMAKIAQSERKGGSRARAVEIFLLRDAEMKRLKKKFLPGKKGPANVLSFAEPADWPNPEGGQEVLGEVYLNADLTELKMDKLIPLLSHGVLHLLGYDHKRKSDRIRMEKMEREIIKVFLINFGARIANKIY